MSYQIFTLPNGLRIVHKASPAPVAHCCVMIMAGSRDEGKDEAGLAHFIEHVLFKETKKRKSFHINNRLESVGGEMNAFTTKEETSIYASFLPEYYDRTLELFSDILFNSVFPENEIKKERKVILEEINSYNDSPAELIFDEFENLVFKEHELGHFILGTPSSVRKVNRESITGFISKNYLPERMVISSCGNIEFRKLVKMSSRYFCTAGTGEGTRHTRIPFDIYSAESKTEKKKTFQAHCISGKPAYDHKDKRRFQLSLLNNILGGPGMNSRLNIVLREKNGLTYNVESGYQPFSDSGVFHIYFGVEQASFTKAQDLIILELKKLREQKLGPVQLKTAKQQLCGQLAIHFEHNLNEVFAMAKSLMINNEILSLEQTFEIINKISADEILEAANEILTPDDFCTLIYKPNKKEYA